MTQPCPSGKSPMPLNHAKKAAKRSSANHDKPMTTYRCPDCGEWHVGSKDPGINKSRRMRSLYTNHSLNLKGAA